MIPDVVISYVPLLYGEPGTLFTKDGIDQVMKEIDESNAGHASGAAWSVEDNAACVTLIMDKATEISKHLIAWSEGMPSDWFSFQLVKNEDGYGIAIMPDMEKSLQRLKSAHKSEEGDSSSIRIIFRPLTFASVTPEAFLAAEYLIKDRIRVFLLDSDLVNPEKMGGNHLNHRIAIGSFPVIRDGIAKDYILDGIRDQKEMNQVKN